MRGLQGRLLAVHLRVRVGEIDDDLLDTAARPGIERLARVRHLLEHIGRHLQIPSVIHLPGLHRLRRRACVAAAFPVHRIEKRGICLAIAFVQHELRAVAWGEGFHVKRAGADRISDEIAVLRVAARLDLLLLHDRAVDIRERCVPKGGRLLEDDRHRRRVRRLDVGDARILAHRAHAVLRRHDVLPRRPDILGGEGRAIGPDDAIAQFPCRALAVRRDRAVGGRGDRFREDGDVGIGGIERCECERFLHEAGGVRVLRAHPGVDAEGRRRLPIQDVERPAATALRRRHAARVGCGVRRRRGGGCTGRARRVCRACRSRLRRLGRAARAAARHQQRHDEQDCPTTELPHLFQSKPLYDHAVSFVPPQSSRLYQSCVHYRPNMIYSVV